jgi:GH15 family glucan-1,4-alpha-glucosidase
VGDAPALRSSSSNLLLERGPPRAAGDPYPGVPRNVCYYANFARAGLVGNDGSIDWLCLPRFDSGACFAALLGTPEHGRWLLAPAGEQRATGRRYCDDMVVLETEFTSADGAVRVVDCM